MIKEKIIFILLFLGGIFNLFSQTKSEELFLKEAKESGKKNEFRKAADLCLKGLKLNSDNLNLTEYLGKSYLELGKLDSARYLLRRVVDYKDKNSVALKYLINTEYESKRYSSAVCYINELLEEVPYDKKLWLKKINIYNDMGNDIEAFKLIKRLKNIFPKDEKINNTYNAIYFKKGNEFVNKTKSGETNIILKKRLKENPKDRDVYLLLIKSELEEANDIGALKYVNKALGIYPKDKVFIKKKVGVLERLKRYDEALIYLEDKTVDKELLTIYKYLLREAKLLYKNRDIYELHKREYEVTKSKGKLIKLISLAISRSYYSEAIFYIKKGLKKDYKDKDLLALQLHLYDKSNDKVNYEKLLDKLHQLYPNYSDFKEKYDRLSYERGKTALLMKQFPTALKEFVYLKETPDYKNLALYNMSTIYDLQKDYDKALVIVDRLVAIDPQQKDVYYFKKASLYEKKGEYEKALAISKMLYEKEPESIQYKNLFTSISESYITFLMRNKQYDKALEVISEIISLRSTPVLYNHAINAALAIKDYERAIAFAEIAKETKTEDKNVLLKLAYVYTKSKKYDKSIALLTFLHKKYQYDNEIRNSLAEVLYLKGKSLEKEGDIVTAIKFYMASVAKGDKKNPAINSLSNLYLQKKEPKKLIKLIDSLQVVNKGNDKLPYKKGLAYEQLKKYDSAFFYLKQHNPSLKEHSIWSNKLKKLKFKSLKNQLDFSYTTNTSDLESLKSDVGSLRYTRFGIKNSFFAELNNVSRNEAMALQLNVGWFHTFSKTIYGKFNYAISNKIFPNHRLGVSIFKSFKNDYELEVGGRYNFFKEERKIITGIIGLSKVIDDFWLNAKLFVLSDTTGKLQNNIVLQSRYFVNETDYVSLMASTGTTPFDENLDFQNNTFYSLVNSMYGGGYFKQINEKMVIGLHLNKYAFEVTDGKFQDQTSILFVLKTKF